MPQPRICLNMIVKNESKIIERCLASMLGKIDCAVICDTGSTDDTKEVIRAFCAQHDIPCEIPEFEFRNFEQARNDALRAAQSSEMAFDYILLTDADMLLETLDDDWRDELGADVHNVEQYNSTISYYNVRLVRKGLDCRYVGVTHEYLEANGTTSNLKRIRFHDTASGANRVEKYERDIRLLTEAMEGDIPERLRTRYMFYLAQTLGDMGDPDRAATTYRKRVEMGGWEEERYFSLYKIGMQHQALIGRDGAEAEMRMVGAFVDAHAARPHRAEPLVELAKHYREKEQYAAAYLFAKQACAAPADADGDILFVRTGDYQFRRWDELGVAAYWVGAYQEAIAACDMALSAPNLSDADRIRVEANAGFARDKLGGSG